MLELIQQFVWSAPSLGMLFILTLATSVFDLLTGQQLSERFMFNAYLVWHRKQYWRLFTSSLVHGNFLHLFINLFVFLNFAIGLSRLYYLNSWELTVIYVGAVLLSHSLDLWRHRNNPAYNAVGASGGVSGIVFAFILLNPAQELHLFFLLPLPGWVFGVLYVAYSWASDRYGQDNIGHGAHLLGAIAGILLTILLFPPAIRTFLSYF